MAVDLAGGNGAGALWLAGRGFTSVLVDVSDVALAVAADRALANGVDLRTHRLDLAGLTLGSVLDRLPDGPAVSVIGCFHYLNRGLLASVADDLPPGATFLASIATVTNLERHTKPSARFLLEPGELHQLVTGVGHSDHGSDLTVIHHFEGWNTDGTNEAEIVVRRTRHSSD